MARSQFLDASLDKAHKLAVSQHHGGVSSEHLLFALTEDPEALVVLGASTVNIDRLRADITTHLGQLPNDTPAGKNILPTADLLKVLKLAAMAAQQSARRQIDGAIVMAAVIGDASTPSAGLLRAHGLTFNEVIRVLQKATAPSADPASPPAMRAPVPPAIAPAPGAAPVRSQEPSTPVSPAIAAADRVSAVDQPASLATAKTAPRASTEELLASVRARLQDAAPPPPVARKEKAPDPVQAAAPAAPLPREVSAPSRAPDVTVTSVADVPPAAKLPTASVPAEPAAAPVTRATDAAAAAAKAFSTPQSTAPAPSPTTASPPMPRPAALLVSPPLAAPVSEAPRVADPSAPPSVRARTSAETFVDGPLTPDDLLRPADAAPAAQAASRPTQPPLPLVPAALQNGGPPPLPLPTVGTPTTPRAPAPSSNIAALAAANLVASQATPAPRDASPRVPPVPPPTVDMRSLIAALPKRLRQGQTDVIEITVPRRSLEIPPAAGHRWPPLRVATMRLRAGNDDAHVELASPETLWISPPRVHQGADDATWRWRVTPRNKGRIRLSLAGATRIVGSEGISGEIPLGEESIEIDVARRGSRRGLVGLLLFGNLLGLGFLAMLMSGRAAEFLGGAWGTLRGLMGSG